MMMSLCKMSLASGYSQMRLKKRLFSFFSSSSHLSNKPKQSYLTPSYQPCNMAYSQQCDINNAQSRSLFSLKKYAAFSNIAVIFPPLSICIPTLCVVESGQGHRAEMNHVCPDGDCASSSAGAAAAAVYEPAWTELIGHMLPGQSVCLALERAKRASLNSCVTRGFSVNI